MTDGLCVRHCSSREFQPAAAAAAYFGFGELEEALIHGGGGASASTGGCGVDPGVITRSDVAAQTKRKPFLFFSSLGTSATCQKGSWARSRFSPRARARPVHSAAQGETCLAFWRPCWFPFLCNTVCSSCSCTAYNGVDADATKMETLRLLSWFLFLMHYFFLLLATSSLSLSATSWHGG